MHAVQYILFYMNVILQSFKSEQKMSQQYQLCDPILVSQVG